MDVSVVSKGGRGKKASYETTHARIPVELKEVVQKLSDDYKLTGNIPSLEPVNSSEITFTKEEAIALANQILKSKKGAKYCLEKLLTGLYSPPVSLD
jgi:hypothetical protein